MKLGVMQPYFFPYIGHFQLIHHVDHWVVLDDVQYINPGWINRNRILHPTEGWQYVNIPVAKHSYKDLIRDIRINQRNDWKAKVINQLAHYKKIAPFYKETVDLAREAMAMETDSIARFNIHTLKTVCAYLGIPFPHQFASESGFDYSEVTHSGQWSLVISEQLQASEYVNPYGGHELYKREEYEAKGIKMSFLKTHAERLTYEQGGRPFEPMLSILDILMFCSVEEIRTMLDQYEVI